MLKLLFVVILSYNLILAGYKSFYLFLLVLTLLLFIFLVTVTTRGPWTGAWVLLRKEGLETHQLTNMITKMSRDTFFSITKERTTFFLSFFFLSFFFFFFFFLSSSLLEEEPEEELESWDVNMIVKLHNHKTDRNQSFENIQRRRRQGVHSSLPFSCLSSSFSSYPSSSSSFSSYHHH